MSGCECEDVARSAEATAERRRVLWIVLAINVVIFVGEFGAGLWANSTALQADSLDSLGDALVYLLSLVVIAGSVHARAGAALVKGGIQALFGIGVLIEVGLKVLHGAEPLAPVMGIAAGAALVANTTCFALLYRHRGEDINMRSVWLCSRNDVIGNAGVLITGFAWPDWVFGALMALLFLSTSLTVVRAAWQQFRAPAVASLRRDAIV
jgi:Co/Zn/Cd efflux system component